MNDSRKLEPIRETMLVNAAIDTVWRVLTSEETVPQWLGCLHYSAEVGAVFYMQQNSAKAAVKDISGATHCEVLALEAPTHFHFSWFLPGTPATQVDFRLRAVTESQTEVSFEHDGWDQFPSDLIGQIREALMGGWISAVLPKLKQVSERSA